MIEQFLQEIQNAEKAGILVSRPQNLTGFSGNKVIGLLQRLCRVFAGRMDASYAEIGVYKGLTLLSVAASCPEITCYGIDSFTYFNPSNENLLGIRKVITDLGLNNIRIIDEDFETAFADRDKKKIETPIAVLFIDGPHDYRGQRMSLEMTLPYLHESAVIVVDDCNYPHVRQANKDFLVIHQEYKLLFEAYTRCHPNDMTEAERQDAERGWWNGVNVIVRDSADRIERILPVTGNRKPFENDHHVHADRFALAAPDALRLIERLHPLQLFDFISACRKMRDRLKAADIPLTSMPPFGGDSSFSGKVRIRSAAMKRPV